MSQCRMCKAFIDSTCGHMSNWLGCSKALIHDITNIHSSIVKLNLVKSSSPDAGVFSSEILDVLVSTVKAWQQLQHHWQVWLLVNATDWHKWDSNWTVWANDNPRILLFLYEYYFSSTNTTFPLWIFFLKISQNFSKFLKISQNFSKFFKISQSLLKISQNFSKSSQNLLKFSQNLSKAGDGI